MQSPQGANLSRREAVLASLVFVEPAEVEERFRRFLAAHVAVLNDWDQRFLNFVERHRQERLLCGAAGGGFEFVFSLRDSIGFWVLESADGVCGKGFLNAHDAGRILQLAREKGLLA